MALLDHCARLQILVIFMQKVGFKQTLSFKKQFLPWIAFAWFCCFGGWSWAAPQLEIPIFDQVELVNDANEVVTQYRLPLGAVKRRSGREFLEQEKHVAGDLYRATYEIPRLYALDEVKDFWLQWINKNNGKILFQCEALACGSSNYWANQLFGNRLLYGPEQSQTLLVAELGERYVVVYIIERGNKKRYYHVDSLVRKSLEQERSLSNDEILKLLTLQKYWIPHSVKIIDGDLKISGGLKEMAELIEKDLADYTVALVGHGDNVAQSKYFADQLLEQLKTAGLSRRDVKLYGVGPYSPRRGEANNRIELVLITP